MKLFFSSFFSTSLLLKSIVGSIARSTHFPQYFLYSPPVFCLSEKQVSGDEKKQRNTKSYDLTANPILNKCIDFPGIVFHKITVSDQNPNDADKRENF